MSFLGDWNRYLSTRTDAPPDFFPHAGLMALAVAMGNKVWCDGWSRSIYPNYWGIIIARSGKGKSVPLDMCGDILVRAQLERRVAGNEFSKEALVYRLDKEPQSALIVQEFAGLMSMLGRDYNQGAIQMLTEIFDVPPVFTRTLVHKEKQGEVRDFTLYKPCLSILGASSPDWFAESYRASALRGGFLARFLFCPAVDSGDYVGHPGPRDLAVEAGLADHLMRVRDLQGAFSLDRVRQAFTDWDRDARRGLADCPAEFGGMRSRAGMWAWKLAMLFHVSRDPRSMVIEERDLENAIGFVEESHRRAEKYLSDDVAHNKADAERMRILDYLRRRLPGGCSWDELIRFSHLSDWELDKHVKTLVAAKLAERRGRVILGTES